MPQIDDEDTKVQYFGDWTSDKAAQNAFNGTLSSTTQPGSLFHIIFSLKELGDATVQSGNCTYHVYSRIYLNGSRQNLLERADTVSICTGPIGSIPVQGTCGVGGGAFVPFNVVNGTACVPCMPATNFVFGPTVPYTLDVTITSAGDGNPFIWDFVQFDAFSDRSSAPTSLPASQIAPPTASSSPHDTSPSTSQALASQSSSPFQSSSTTGTHISHKVGYVAACSMLGGFAFICLAAIVYTWYRRRRKPVQELSSVEAWSSTDRLRGTPSTCWYLHTAHRKPS